MLILCSLVRAICRGWKWSCVLPFLCRRPSDGHNVCWGNHHDMIRPIVNQASFFPGWETVSRYERLSRVSHWLWNLWPGWQDLWSWVQGAHPEIVIKNCCLIPKLPSSWRCSELVPSSILDSPSNSLSHLYFRLRWSLMQRWSPTYWPSCPSWTRWWRRAWSSWRPLGCWVKWGSWG